MEKGSDRKEREEDRSWSDKAPLLLTSFSIGFFAIISQVVFLREILVVFYGNELCIGLVFAIWLTGIFSGAFLASYGKGSHSRLVLLAAVILTAFLFFTPLQVSLIRLSRIIFLISPGEYIPLPRIFLASSLFVLPTSFIVGALFPLAAKIFSSGTGRTAAVVTTLYVWEAMGSLVGGILFTFFLVPYRDTFTILFLSSLFPSMAIGMLSFLPLSPLMKRSLRVVSASLMAAVLLLLLSGFSGKIQEATAQKRWSSFAGEVELAAEKDSKYQNLAISRQEDLYSFYFNGQYGNSFPDPYQSTVKAHLILSQHPAPETILIIGGGYTGLIPEILKYPIRRVDYVELDPALIPLALRFLPRENAEALSDPRVHIHHTDGRHFVKFTKQRYDIILVQSPDPSTAYANRYYTLDFFREVKQKLNMSGLFVTSLSSSQNYFGEERLGYVSSVYNSIKRIFRYVVISPAEEACFFASDAEETPSSDPARLASRFEERKIHSDLFTGDFFKLSFPPDRVTFVTETLENSPMKEFNTDFRPVTYFHSLKLWARYSGSSIQTLLKIFEQQGRKIWAFSVLLLFLLFLIATMALRARGRDSSRPFLTLCIASTGFAGMAWSLVLIFSFQNILGYLYSEIGWLVALFMLGLALGGLSMKGLFGTIPERGLIIVADLAALLFCFLLLPLLNLLYSMEMEAALSTELFFAFLILLSGFLTGFEFPVAIKLYLAVSKDIRRSAGIIDAADHVGAAFGALLTGVLLIPLGGLWITTLAIGSLKAVSFLILVIGLLQSRTSRPIS